MSTATYTLKHNIPKIDIHSELQAFSTWFELSLVPAAHEMGIHTRDVARWRAELGQVNTLLNDTKNIRIALVGSTGAGKSTFLNSLLGVEVLPVGVMEPCTAFVTTVCHSDTGLYRLVIDYLTPKEWEEDFAILKRTLINEGDMDENAGGRAETRRIMDAARKRIQAVYQIKPDVEITSEELQSVELPLKVKQVFERGSRDEQDFQDSTSMLKFLREMVHQSSSLWPLIRHVEVAGNFPSLSGGLELVDLPGLNDPNEARVEVTRKYLQSSPYVWILFPMVRGLTNDIQVILRDERLLQHLIFSGAYSTFALIGTKADDIDTNDAASLGLSEDCEQFELVRAYRSQIAAKVREQLLGMVRDITNGSEDRETVRRMLEVGRNVPVYATSASAYNRLSNIGKRRKDYGLDDPADTGIPDVLAHLNKIRAEIGAADREQVAKARLAQLRSELDTFFRAYNRPAGPEMERARTHFNQKLQSFQSRLDKSHDRARQQLDTFRKQFLGEVEDCLEPSIQGVGFVVESWANLHWATLRAIINHDGIYRSYTTGHLYDFNEAIAQPLLDRLIVSWQRFFTDDLGRVLDDFLHDVEQANDHLDEQLRDTIALLFSRDTGQLNERIKGFHNRQSMLITDTKRQLLTQVREQRSELRAQIPHTVRASMQVAFDLAKNERGRGMKHRILTILNERARQSARPIYENIQRDLIETLHSLMGMVDGVLHDMTKSSIQYAEGLVQNAHVDLEEATIDPRSAQVLSSLAQAMNQL